MKPLHVNSRIHSSASQSQLLTLFSPSQMVGSNYFHLLYMQTCFPLNHFSLSFLTYISINQKLEPTILDHVNYQCILIRSNTQCKFLCIIPMLLLLLLLLFSSHIVLQMFCLKKKLAQVFEMLEIFALLRLNPQHLFGQILRHSVIILQ